jgi:hypothetical protein
MRRLAIVTAMAASLILVQAPPALADPAVPSNYRSRVTDLDPSPNGLAIDVMGGDAFLVVAVAPGHRLEVPGYFGEPYLLIDQTGTVWRNELSPARWINTDRYGTTIPLNADASAEPDWREVASGGTYAWHDHRTHWMSKDLPPAVTGDRAEVVFPWEFPVRFDGEEVIVGGELVWFPSTNPAGPLLLGILGIGPLIGWRPGRRWLTASTLAGVGAIALFTATMQYLATPIDRSLPTGMILPAVSILAALGSLAITNRIRSTGALLLSGIALVFWAVGTLDVMSAPVLPSALDAGLERMLVAITLIAALAVCVLTVSEALLERRAARLGPNPKETE